MTKKLILNILKMNDWFRIVAVMFIINLLWILGLIVQKSERTVLLRFVPKFMLIVPRIVLDQARLVVRDHRLLGLGATFVELLDRS